MGYYNGKDNRNLISKPDDEKWVNAFSSYGFGNRNPNWNYSKLGMLQKIIYPTGGYDNIIYEPHLVYNNGTMPLSAIDPNTNLSFNGIGGDFKQLVVLETEAFNVYNNHIASLLATCHLKDGIDPADSKYYYIIVELFENGVSIFKQRVDLETDLNTIINLRAGKTYQFKISHFSDVTSFLSFDYNNSPLIINWEIPGVRVKKIVSVSGIGAATERNFFYTTLEEPDRSCGISYNLFPANRTFYTNHTPKDCGASTLCCYQECEYIRYSSGSFYDLFSYSGQHIYYPTVLEADKDDFSNGLTEHQFWVVPDNNANIVWGDQVMNGPLTNSGVGFNGKEYLTNYYKANNNGRILIRQVRKSFKDDERLRRSTNFFALMATGSGASLCASCSSTQGSVFDYKNVTCLNYQLLSRWVYNDSVITKEFDENGNISLTTIQVNQYDNALHQLPTKTIFFTSRGGTLTKIAKYPQDVINEDPSHINSAGATSDNWQAFNSLVANHIINVPIEQLTLRDSKQTEDVVNLYRINPGNNIPHLAAVNVSQLDFPFEKRYEVLKYDAKGNMLEQRKASGETHSYVWDYNGQYPIAEVINASSVDIAYSSFESDGSGGWVIGSSERTSNGITGNKSYPLSSVAITKEGLTSGTTYIVSYWTTNASAYMINGTRGVLRGKSINGWTYFEHTVSGVTQVEIPSVGGLIDELRLYPSGALMTTYTYAPFIGMTSQCDARNILTYYEYDGLNRLLRIRDGDKNIVKQFEYQYQVFPTLTPIWQRTNNTRCKPCDANPNYISQFFQAEELDINPGSPTAGTTRWVDVPGGSCVPMADWQFTNTPIRCKAPNGINTGEQEREQMDMNPCSASYANTRWVVVGTNTSVCTVCNSANCGIEGYKCVNNSCEVGVQVYTSKVQIAVKTWECTYHYEFSDGSWSQNYFEITNSALLCQF
jgi:hypothetical protein